MSARQCFALCIDCWEMHYGISDANGVYSRDSGSSNHFDHAVHVFGPPADYPSSLEQPIRRVLIDLEMGIPISSAALELFSLCCAVTAIQPNNGRKVRGGDVPLGALEMRRTKRRGQPGDASQAPQDELFGGAA